MEFNIISLLHSVRVLPLSANVKFACNNVRLFNAERDYLEYSLRFLLYACAGILNQAY